jgi:hypothetical protein
MARARTKETKEMATPFQTLDASAIQELLAKSKQRGEYDRQLKNFLESDVPGIQVPLTEGIFQGKASSSVKAGFEGAKKREGAPDGSSEVRVIVDGENVYLIRQDLA